MPFMYNELMHCLVIASHPRCDFGYDEHAGGDTDGNDDDADATCVCWEKSCGSDSISGAEKSTVATVVPPVVPLLLGLVVWAGK